MPNVHGWIEKVVRLTINLGVCTLFIQFCLSITVFQTDLCDLNPCKCFLAGVGVRLKIITQIISLCCFQPRDRSLVQKNVFVIFVLYETSEAEMQGFVKCLDHENRHNIQLLYFVIEV